MQVFTRRIEAADPAAATLFVSGELRLDWDRRQRSRLRARVARGARAGQEVGLDLPRGGVLRDGDLVVTEDGTAALRVAAAAEQLLHVTAHGAMALARLAYHLGNRHVPLQVGGSAAEGGWLRLPLDHVLENMVEGLGGTVSVVSAPFDPESGAYAGHAHGPQGTPAEGGADGRHAPRIHDFTGDPA